MSYRIVLALLWLACSAIIFDARTASACSCGGRPTVLEEYDRSKNVVIAQVVFVEKSNEERRFVNNVMSTRLIVEKVFKRSLKAGEEMTFAQGGGGDCIWTFSESEIGKRFLFYLSDKRKGESLWYAFICGRSQGAEYAADDLLYLENIAKVRGKTRLSGTLAYSQRSPIEGQEPIDRALGGTRLRVVGEKKTYELTTNQNGVYEIYDLPAGKYRIEPEVPTGWKIDYPSAAQSGETSQKAEATSKQSFQISVEAGRHTFIDFLYGANNALRGKVLDASGNGMKSVCLDLLPAEGKIAKYFSEHDCTEQDGSFEFLGVPPGRYVIAINKNGKISSSEPFPVFYFPNVSEREKAEVITIGLGQVIEDLNIFVPGMEETITVEGVVLFADGKPVIDEAIKFEAVGTPEGVEGKASTTPDASGRFSLKILKGLKGTLYAEMYAHSGEFENCPKIESLIQQAKSRGATLHTNAREIRAEENIKNIELRFPFPKCERSKEK